MGGIYSSNPAAINAQYSERLTHARLLLFILGRTRVVSVAVASPDLSVHTVYFGVRLLVSGDVLRFINGLRLGAGNLGRLAVTFAFNRPAIGMFYNVLIFTFSHD